MQSSGGGNRDVDVRVGSLPEVDETPLAEVVNEAGEVVRSFGERKPYEDQRLGMLGNAVVLAYSPENGEVALVFRTSEEIHIYDPRTGEPKRIITRDIPFTPRVPSFEEQRISSPDGREVQIMVQPIADTVSRAAAYDAQGRLWVIAMLLDYDELTEREEEGDYAGMSRLEVYAPNGTLLTAVVMEDPSDRIVFDDSGDLWLLDTEYEALLRRYQVSWPQ